MASALRRVQYPDLVQRANEARRRPNDVEAALRDLMAARFGRARFRHQRIVKRYIVDFLFPEERLIIEVDGPMHAALNAAFRDARRDDDLRRLGYYVLRVEPHHVIHHPQELMRLLGRLLHRLRAEAHAA